jgi:hypothetical protein
MKKTILYPSITAVALFVIGGVLLYSLYIQKVTVTGHALLPVISKDELISKSKLIAVAKVLHQKSKYVERADGDGLPNVSTEVTLRIEKLLKNNSAFAPNEIVVEVLGGTMSRTSVAIEGVATFQEDERVLVFLEENKNGNFTVYGWMNGKYSLDSEKIKISESDRFKSIFGDISTVEQISAEIKKLGSSDPVDISTGKQEQKNVPSKDANGEANMIIQKSE